jgi:hypothetical protein
MDRDEFEALLQKAEDRKRRAIQAAESECTLCVEALHRVWELAHDGDPSTPVGGGDLRRSLRVSEEPHPLGGYGGLAPLMGATVLVREAIMRLPDEFSMPDIFEELQHSNPAAQVKRDTISGVLHKLAKQGEIVLQVPGAGKVAATYRKKSSLPSASADLMTVASGGE